MFLDEKDVGFQLEMLEVISEFVSFPNTINTLTKAIDILCCQCELRYGHPQLMRGAAHPLEGC